MVSVRGCWGFCFVLWWVFLFLCFVLFFKGINYFSETWFHWRKAIFWTEEQCDIEIQDASLVTFCTSELQMYLPVLLLQERSFYYTCMQIQRQNISVSLITWQLFGYKEPVYLPGISIKVFDSSWHKVCSSQGSINLLHSPEFSWRDDCRSKFEDLQ